MTHGSLIARGWKALQLVEVLVALVPCALAERTHGLIDEAELLPTDCAEGVLHLAGRYKTVESVEYPEGCTLHGEPGTEVDVLGEVHFLKDARLSGSLVFRGSKHRERQHRCVDVEGSLDFAGSSQVDFISCGGEETEDGGGVYVEQNFTFDSGRLRFQGGVAGWGGCLYVGQHLVLNGGTVLFEDCRATTGGGALFVKAGHYSHQAGNVSFQRAFAKAHGGAMMLEGRFKQYGGHILFEDCLALKSGGGISASMYSVKGKRKQIGNVEQFGGTIRARNCTSVRDNINGNGGVINTNWLNVKGLVELDGCEAGNGGCIAARKGVTVGPSGQLRISNCWSNELGGAIFVGLWMKVKGLLHVANCSSHSGGAVNCRSKVSLLGTADVRFENVTASAGNGGAIWAINVTQEGGTFACWRCRAATSGGAIYAQAVLRLSGQMSFQRCRAHMGGALHVVGVIQQKGEMSFKDCKSVGSGGAIHSIGQIEQWEGSTAHFTTCRSLKSGGAIFAASVQQKGDMAFEDCSAKRSGGAMSVTDATNVETATNARRPRGPRDLKFTRVGAGGVGKKGSPAANRRNRLSKYIKSLKSARGSVQLLGSTTFERCWAGAGGALYARQDLLLAPTARALFRDCGADAFGGALNGRDVRLLGESEFRNITALAGGVIQSTGEVIIPEETHAVMQRTSAPQISALKLINMSNLSLENTSHVWFVAPEIHLKQVKCDNGLASFKQPHHVGCVSCEENKIQVFGNPILDDDLPLKTCWSAPRGTAHVDMHHLKLKIGYMVEKANISRSFRCPNRLACMGGEISTEGFGEMCAEGYRGQGCVKCEKGYGSSDSNRFVCVACASSVWRQRMQMGRFVLEDLLLFALSVSGVASTSGEKESKILTNHFMSFVAAAGPVIQAVQETPTFKRIMSHLDVYVEGLSTSVEAGEGSGSSAAGGMSARCIQGYLNLPKNWWCRALLTLFTPFCAIAALMAMRGWRIAAVVGVNCFLPKACLCFARYLVCYRMEPEHEGGELFCAYRMYTGFSLLGLLLLVAAIACSGPVLWWRLLSDKSHSDAPYYLYLSASYKEDLKSWEVTRLVRKVFLAVICAALPVSLHPAMQIMCISLVLLTALILEMQFRPYKDSFWNLEEKTLLTVSLAMVSVTSCYLANEYHWSSTYRTQQFLLLVILVLSIVPTNVLVFQIIVQLLRERGFLKSREAA